MNPQTELWRSRMGLWLPPLLLVLLGLGALLFYRMNYADDSAGLERRLETRNLRLAEVKAERQQLEARVEAARASRDQITELYEERFSTQRQRFSQMHEEVKRLAQQAGLDPGAISYPRAEIADFGLIEREVVFSVHGSYRDLRTFVNLLEVSPSFIALKQVALAESKDRGRGGSLQISLTLSTLFQAEEGDRRAAS